ncbi:MAG: MucR family transcriptional regulator [Acetobacteraceae bacterium]
MAEDTKPSELLALTAQIVSAHLSHNTVAPGDVASLIRDVHGTLAGLAGGAAAAAPAEKPTPAVPVKKSIHPDYLICLEDGKKLKMLKRHLKSAFNMTPEQYRERWGLPADYPMVAPNYAEKRSELAKRIGLGTKPRAAGAAKDAPKGRRRGAA